TVPGPVRLPSRLRELAGGTAAAEAALAALGYQVHRSPEGTQIQAPARRANGHGDGRRRARRRPSARAGDSPFAKLRERDPET
ncbi:MAG TPA: hypothetical protein VIK47_04035, partial [Kiloniellales bacterium]